MPACVKCVLRMSSWFKKVKAIAQALDVEFIGIGFDPESKHEDAPLMPKGRYKLMRSYMPTVGTLGLDMMFRSCTIQVCGMLVDFYSSIRHLRPCWLAYISILLKQCYGCVVRFLWLSNFAKFFVKSDGFRACLIVFEDS